MAYGDNPGKRTPKPKPKPVAKKKKKFTLPPKFKTEAGNTHTGTPKKGPPTPNTTHNRPQSRPAPKQQPGPVRKTDRKKVVDYTKRRAKNPGMDAEDRARAENYKRTDEFFKTKHDATKARYRTASEATKRKMFGDPEADAKGAQSGKYLRTMVSTEKRLAKIKRDKFNEGLKAELEGRGKFAKFLKQSAKGIEKAVTNSGGGRHVGGGAAVSVNQIRTPGVDKALKFTGRGVSDVVNFPAQVPASVYVPAAALKEGVVNKDWSRAKKLAKDIDDSDPVFNTLQAGAKAIKGDSKGAKEAIRQAGKAASEHPGYTAIEIVGTKGATGRTISRSLRTGGKVEAKVGEKVGSTHLKKTGAKAQKVGGIRREPKRLEGTNIEVHREYSRDIFKKGHQVVSEKRDRKKAAKLREKAKKQKPDERKATLQEAHAIDPDTVKNDEIRQRYDEREAVNEDVRRNNRAEAIHHAQEALGGRRGMSKAGAAYSLIGQNIVKANRKDFEAYRDELADMHEHGDLTPQERLANEQLRADIDRVLKRNSDDDLKGIETRVREYGRQQKPKQDVLVEKKMLGKEQRAKAAEIPFAVRHMDAEYDNAFRMTDEGVQEFVTRHRRKQAARTYFRTTKKVQTTGKARAAAVAGARVSAAKTKRSPRLDVLEREATRAEARLTSRRRAVAVERGKRKTRAEIRERKATKTYLRGDKTYRDLETQLRDANKAKREAREKARIAERRVKEGKQKNANAKLKKLREASANSLDLANRLEARRGQLMAARPTKPRDKAAAQVEAAQSLDNYAKGLARDVKAGAAKLAEVYGSRPDGVTDGEWSGLRSAREAMTYGQYTVYKRGGGRRDRPRSEQHLEAVKRVAQRVGDDDVVRFLDELLRHQLAGGPRPKPRTRTKTERESEFDSLLEETAPKAPLVDRQLTPKAPVTKAKRQGTTADAKAKPSKLVQRDKQLRDEADAAVKAERKRLRGVELHGTPPRRTAAPKPEAPTRARSVLKFIDEPTTPARGKKPTPSPVDRFFRADRDHDQAKAEQAAAREAGLEARQAHIDAKQAAVGKPRKEKPGLVDHTGRKLDSKTIANERRELHGLPEPIFLTQAANSRGARNFHIVSSRMPSAGPFGRTGKATKAGTFDAHPDTLVEQAARTQGLIDAHNGFTGFIKEFGFHDENGKLVTGTRQQLEKRLQHLPPGGTEWRMVRVNPWGGSREQLEYLIEQAGSDVQRVSEVYRDMLNKAIHGEGEGDFALVPEAAADQMAQHVRVLGGTDFAKAWQKANQLFRGSVLATSPSWWAGNVIEATLRAAVGGAGPRAWITANKIDKKMKADLSPREYAEWRSRTMGGGHMAMQVRTRVSRTADTFDPETKIGRMAVRLGRFFERDGVQVKDRTVVPGPKQAAGAWHGYTHLVFDVVNRRMEAGFQKAMLGAEVRRSHLMDDQLLKTGTKAIEQAAQGLKNTNEQAHFGRLVDRMYGRYGKFSPSKRAAIALYTPFVAWSLNAVDFVFRVLPQDHPALTALLASVQIATDEWREDNALNIFMEGALPGFLQGSIPEGDGSHWRPGRYTPFGAFGDLPATFAAAFVPQGQGLLKAGAYGEDWKGAKIEPFLGMGNKEASPVEKALYGGWSFISATIPAVAVTNRIIRTAEDPRPKKVFGLHVDPHEDKKPKKLKIAKPKRRRSSPTSTPSGIYGGSSGRSSSSSGSIYGGSGSSSSGSSGSIYGP